MPQEILLQTKLFKPPLRRNLVPRARLLAKLNQALSPETRLTLISAPAGFGKTTLISEWLQNRQAETTGKKPDFTWFTLDEADNDPVQFWRYIDAALQAVDSRLGKSIRPAVSAPQPAPYRSLVAGIISDILQTGAHFTLVLDDYHNITNEAIHEGLNYLIDHLPASVNIIITTRFDPPLQLARRRSRGELCEVRASDLRFTREEIARLLNNVMSLDLSVEDIAALEERTEGWVAGLQMAAISMQDAADPHTFVTAFRGDDHYIADYLVEEVLQRQPVEFQRFLLETSILHRLCGPLCDTVTGRSDSQSVLNTLERANLFLVPLDNRREWFRYHQLFASLLYQRLVDSSDAETIKTLKRRAAEWYSSHGYFDEAVEALIECSDFSKAAEVIENADQYLFMANGLNLLVKWSGRIPQEIIACRPRLNAMAAWASQATGSPKQAQQLINLMEKTIGTTVDQFLCDPTPSGTLSLLQKACLIEAAVLESRLAVDAMDLEKAVSVGQRVLPNLVPDSTGDVCAFNYPYLYRGPELVVLGLADKFRGNFEAASQAFMQAEQNAEQVVNPHIIALSLGHLGEIQAAQGNVAQARSTFTMALKKAGEFPPQATAFWGLASIGLGNLALEQNDLVEAETHLKTGLELGRSWHVWEILLPGCLGQSRLHQAYGEWEQAAQALDGLMELASGNIQNVEPAVAAQQALQALRQGDLQAAAAWASSFDAHSSSPYPLQWEQNALIAARIWLARKEYPELEALLTRLHNDARSKGHNRTLIELYILQALLSGQQNESEKACQSLQLALEMAAPGGYIRLFLEEGPPLLHLLEACLTTIHDPILRQYADRLQRSFAHTVQTRPASTAARVATPDQKNIIEPLSERELEVLRLMADGLSNPAIAKKLYLSTNTLKAHAQNIYTKLDVHNRLEAVNKAREIGLLLP